QGCVRCSSGSWFPECAGVAQPRSHHQDGVMEPSRVELTGKLSGRRIVLTAQRRAEQLASALQRHGASIVHAPTLSVIPHIDDPELIARTPALIKHRDRKSP